MPIPPAPQPKKDTRLGFHYFPDDAHYRELDRLTWLPELVALGATWLALHGSLERAIPEAFLRGLIEAGIEPIVHLHAGPIRRLDQTPLRFLLQAYARWGVRYLTIFSEPNARGAWSGADWGKPALVERALDAILPNLLTQADVGLVPLFPPLKPGGDYWDTAFLDAALDGLQRRANRALHDRLAFSFFADTRNRPADWGAGGPTRWPEARPYATPPGSEDQLGLHISEWYDAIIRIHFGEARPLVCLAGGPVLGDAQDNSFPPVDEHRHISCTEEVVTAVRSGQLPASVLNHNFWLLAADPTNAAASQAWYRADGTQLPTVDLLKAHRAGPANGRAPDGLSVAPAGKNAKTQNGHASNGKALHHYLLLPVYEWGVPDWHWNAVKEYVKAFRPACGFSPEEASQAEHVTIVGSEQGVSAEVERMLAHAGCIVDRIAGSDGAAIEARLKQLAQSGRRFVHGD